MNIPLLIAAATLFFVGIMHTMVAEWRGNRRLVRRVVQSKLFDDDAQDIAAKQIIRLAWHLTSLAWCSTAVVLAYLSSAERTLAVVGTIRILAVTFLCHSALSLVITRGRHPSWYLFLMVSIFSFLGTVPPS